MRGRLIHTLQDLQAKDVAEFCRASMQSGMLSRLLILHAHDGVFPLYVVSALSYWISIISMNLQALITYKLMSYNKAKLIMFANSSSLLISHAV